MTPITSTQSSDLHRWMTFRGKGDVIRAIVSPEVTYQLDMGTISPAGLGYLQTLLSEADVVRIEGLTGGLVLMTEDMFQTLTGEPA